MYKNDTVVEEGQCGECYKVGPLHEIQVHFMEAHVQAPELAAKEASPSATETLEACGSKGEETRWSAEQVLLLIRLVEQNQENFEKGLKKATWLQIATKLSTMTNKIFTCEQVDNKWKGLKKTYKNVKDHNNKSGNTPKKWQYFSALDSFMGKKPEIEPEATCSSTSLSVKKKHEEKDSESDGTISRKKKKLSEVEARHKEKMNKYDKFLKLFQLSVENQIGKKIEPDDDSD